VTDLAQRPWRHRVEHVDTDASGVVHFSRYASLLETVVLDFLEASGAGLTALAEHGLELVVTELRIKYMSPARYFDVVLGCAVINRVGGAQFRSDVALYREEAHGARTALVTGSLAFGTVRGASGAPSALPTAVRNTLKGLVTDAERHASS
jgi:acyl-CoA thioester hydrolase